MLCFSLSGCCSFLLSLRQRYLGNVVRAHTWPVRKLDSFMRGRTGSERIFCVSDPVSYFCWEHCSVIFSLLDLVVVCYYDGGSCGMDVGMGAVSKRPRHVVVIFGSACAVLGGTRLV